MRAVAVATRFRHRTVTGTDLVAGRVTALSAVGFPEAKASMDSLMLRGRRMAVLAVVLTAAGLAVCVGGRRSRRALWIVSLSTAALCLVPGSLSGGWRGLQPADPERLPALRDDRRLPCGRLDAGCDRERGGYMPDRVALARPAALPRPPRAAARLLPASTSCSSRSRQASQGGYSMSSSAMPGSASCSDGWRWPSTGSCLRGCLAMRRSASAVATSL